jgi:cysteine-rich repeat protein
MAAARRWAALLQAACLLGAAAVAQAQPASVPPRRPIGPLTGPSRSDPEVIARDYLQRESGGLGLAGDDLEELAVKDRAVALRTGISHLYLRQRLGGIDVFNAGATLATDREGRLVAFGDRLVRRLRARARFAEPAVSAADAILRAAAHLKLGTAAAPTELRRPGGPARAAVFAPGGISRDEIPVRLEWVPQGEADLKLAWNLVIRTPDGRHWWNLHVDARTGQVLRQNDWIDHDSYRVFPAPLVGPDQGPRSLLANPADPVASPHGWHDTNNAPGAEFTDTRGNNVFAQEDTDASNTGGYRPSGGGGLVFDAPLDLSLQPSNDLDASIANLFYWNNHLHDVFWHHGFDEPAGNFQQNNYGSGGAAADPVQADDQDGLDVDNAQFATPPDGTAPRMEMFLWNQSPPPQLTVNTPPAIAGSYAAGRALFGAGTLGLADDVVLALDPNDASGPSTTDGCSALTNAGSVAGRIALIDRGTCNFTVKVKNAQNAGAVGAVIANNVNTGLVNMSGMDPTILVPAVFITKATGDLIKGQLGAGVTATLVSPADRSGSFDGAVIAHEYGHGVSNRLTGGPANVNCLDLAQSAGMGEGWSDFLGLVFTAKPEDQSEDPMTLATYLLGEPPSGPGLRNHPYSTDLGISPLTYGDISSLNQPHGVGEVWAVALWEIYWSLVDVHGFDPDLIAGTGGNQAMLDLVLQGMKLQPCDPTFLDARDAILNADAALNDGVHECLIWSGFAKRGMGVSATDGPGPQSLNVNEAFNIPGACTPECGDSTLQAGEQCDDGNTVPFDGCAAVCRYETLLQIFGVAQGGSASVTIDGVLVSVPTSAGQTAAQVAAALAAAIEANPTLAAAGIVAEAQNGQIAVTGSVSGFTLSDPGLSQQAPIPVPSLSPAGSALAAIALALVAWICGGFPTAASPGRAGSRPRRGSDPGSRDRAGTARP